MKSRSSHRVAPAAAVAALGWLVPGGGYLLLGRTRQFALFLLLVSGAFGVGLALHGGNLWPQSGELQGVDGFTALLAQAGTLMKILAGGPYLVAWLFDYSQSFIHGRLYEYGTMLLIVAGLLNLLAVTDALELRKTEAQ